MTDRASPDSTRIRQEALSLRLRLSSAAIQGLAEYFDIMRLPSRERADAFRGKQVERLHLLRGALETIRTSGAAEVDILPVRTSPASAELDLTSIQFTDPRSGRLIRLCGIWVRGAPQGEGHPQETDDNFIYLSQPPQNNEEITVAATRWLHQRFPDCCHIALRVASAEKSRKMLETHVLPRN